LKPSKYGLVRKIKKFLGHVYTIALLFLEIISQILFFRRKLSLNPVDLKVDVQSYQRVAVFAAFINSFDEQNEAQRVISQIWNKFDRVLVINTGDIPISASYANVHIFSRDNFGRDLTSYKLASELLNLENTSEIFFFNDSVIWSENSLSNFLIKARECEYEVTSLTSSDQYTFHLQSYALHLKGDVVELIKAFRVFRVSNFKRLIVEGGEKAISRFWISKNVNIGGIYNQNTLRPLFENYVDLYPEDYDILQKLISQNVPLNPSIHLWAPLYAASGVIKKALISRNPAKLKYFPRSLAEIQLRIDLIN
jgi:hypothetical protein